MIFLQFTLICQWTTQQEITYCHPRVGQGSSQLFCPSISHLGYFFFFHLAQIKLLNLNLDIWNPTLYGRHPKYSMTSLALGYINIKTSILPSIKFLVPLPGELAFFNIGVCLSIRGWAFQKNPKNFEKSKIFKKQKNQNDFFSFTSI